MLSPPTEAAIARANALLRLRFPWWLRLVTMRGVIGITIGRRIFLAAGELPGEKLEQVIRHELAHVRQVASLGFLRFYTTYAVEYLVNRRKGMPPAEAYARISFEVEAEAAEREEPGPARTP